MNEITPFTPQKVYCLHSHWTKIKDWYEHKLSDLPFAWTVSVDPATTCQMKCWKCNSEFLLDKSKRHTLSEQYLDELVEFLSKWGTKGTCFGGSGEGLMNPYTGTCMKKLKERGVGSSLITNGLLIHKHPDLKYADFVGISVDAASPKIWAEVHGIKNERLFDKVLENMQWLIDKNVQTTFKFLLRPHSIHEVYHAAKIASEMECFALHIRPCEPTWWQDNKEHFFTSKDRDEVNKQINNAREDFSNIKIVGIFDKVGKNWEIVHPFKKCWAVLASTVFTSNQGFCMCCDRRSDKQVSFGPMEHPENILDFWGSDDHRKLVENICVDRCPRCTWATYNKYFEEAVLLDGFMLDFI